MRLVRVPITNGGEQRTILVNPTQVHHILPNSIISETSGCSLRLVEGFVYEVPILAEHLAEKLGIKVI